MTSKFMLAAACLTGLALSACAPVAVIGTGAMVAHTVAEERSAKDALKDTQIKLGIENGLLSRSETLFGDVLVDVNEGRVLLLGSVPTAEDKAAASRIAWGIDGVSAVEDEVIVDGDSSARSYVEDVRISNEVRLQLLGDSDVASQNYDVHTFRRTVHLTGLAKSPKELDRAIQHAQEVKGVSRVVSHVLTVDDPRRARAAKSG